MWPLYDWLIMEKLRQGSSARRCICPLLGQEIVSGSFLNEPLWRSHGDPWLRAAFLLFLLRTRDKNWEEERKKFSRKKVNQIMVGVLSSRVKPEL